MRDGGTGISGMALKIGRCGWIEKDVGSKTVLVMNCICYFYCAAIQITVTFTKIEKLERTEFDEVTTLVLDKMSLWQ